MRNPYFILGVQPQASRDEIKSAYRRLAMAFHPDLNQDDFTAQERFAEINAAHQLLGDPDRRRLFDEGLIDARGRPRPSARPKRQANPFAAHTVNSATVEPAVGDTADDVGQSIFGDAYQRDPEPAGPAAEAAAARPKREQVDAPGIDDIPLGETTHDATGPATARRPGWSLFDMTLKPLFGFMGSRETSGEERRDTTIDLPITLEEVISGAQRPVELPDGTSATINVPLGAADGHTVRLRGHGEANASGARGDAVVTLRYQRHDHFRVEGRNLHAELPVSLEDAVFGRTARLSGLDGDIEIVVPEWSGSDRRIVVAGKGLPDADGLRGDLVAEIRIMLSKEPDEKLIDLLRLRRGEWYV
jgi:DnaJ-class molecular chaperone